MKTHKKLLYFKPFVKIEYWVCFDQTLSVKGLGVSSQGGGGRIEVTWDHGIYTVKTVT